MSDIKIYFRIPFMMYFVGRKKMEPLNWADTNPKDPETTWSNLLLFRKHFNPVGKPPYYFRDI